MILDKLKEWALALLAIAAAVLAALFYREKAKREGDERKDVEAARKIEQDATKALTDGLAKEQEGQERATRDPYKHFE